MGRAIEKDHTPCSEKSGPWRQPSDSLDRHCNLPAFGRLFVGLTVEEECRTSSTTELADAELCERQEDVLVRGASGGGEKADEEIGRGEGADEERIAGR